ncbi:MAG: hydrolase [Coprobacillus sp.]|nr:hydrolase [Coprobacillus sp.]
MSKGYSIFLNGVQYPVVPESIELSVNNQNETINLINDDEVNVLKKAGLTDISFELLLPQVYYPFAQYPKGFKKASYYLDKIEKLKTSKKPFTYILTRATPSGKLLFDTNMSVSLEDYTINEDASNGLDIVVSLNLKQYKSYSTKVLTVKKKKVTSNKKTTTKNTVKNKKTRAKTASKKKSKKVTKGCTVVVNGRLHRDSYGKGAGQKKTNYKGKINFIKKGRKCPYHVTTPNGGWLGWVTESSIKVV